MTFKKAVIDSPALARTENGMKTFSSSSRKLVDLFALVGASRGQDLSSLFESAFHENKNVAMRLALWARDARGGAGEREHFRKFLKVLETYHPQELTESFLRKVPEVGRWDDLLVFETPAARELAFKLIQEALDNSNGLCAKWMPRKGKIAGALRSYLEMSPRAYRKRLVELTRVVEQQMCANDWNKITYDHVPSVAMSRYMKAFWKHSPERMEKYKSSLVKGTAKINAAVLYPYQVIAALKQGNDKTIVDKMWDSLPNWIAEDSAILPLVDVSGSMSGVRVDKTTTALDVAVSLGLYCADKNTGAFKDLFLTFSASPKFMHLKGTLSQKMFQMSGSDWGMNTNLHAAFEEILRVAVGKRVPAKDMPRYLLIMSDMEFDACAKYDDSAMQMIQRKYRENGYNVPAIIFWNLSGKSGRQPVSYNTKGTALISGFSAGVMKSVLAADFADLSPQKIMLETLMNARYDF